VLQQRIFGKRRSWRSQNFVWIINLENRVKKTGIDFWEVAKKLQLFEQYSESFRKLENLEKEVKPLGERLKVLQAQKKSN
jgi:hypothetical protein